MNFDPTAGAYPTAEAVFDDIGEKPLIAFASAVVRARDDLAEYRRTFPQWVADHGERGLANWISDRQWTHLVNLAESVPGMEVTEKGVTREVTIGFQYRLRMKRHDELGIVASYPTPTFLEFATQPGGQLPGLEEVRLIAGYEWIKDERSIGQPVMSLRDGRDNIIWCVALPFPGVGELGGEGEGTGIAPVITPETPAPTAPVVEVGDDVRRASKESTEDE